MTNTEKELNQNLLSIRDSLRGIKWILKIIAFLFLISLGITGDAFWFVVVLILLG